MAIATSGIEKGLLEPQDIVEIDEQQRVIRGSGTPSAETTLHLAIVRARRAGAGLHTHSVWSTILSEDAAAGGVTVEGYEMLKGVGGVRTHQHRERLGVNGKKQE